MIDGHVFTCIMSQHFTCIMSQHFASIIKRIVNNDKSKFYYVSCRGHVRMVDGHIFTPYQNFVRIINQIVNNDKSKLHLVSYCGRRDRMVFGLQSTYAINAHSKKKNTKIQNKNQQAKKMPLHFPPVARCTRYNFMWYSLSVPCDASLYLSDTLVSSTISVTLNIKDF